MSNYSSVVISIYGRLGGHNHPIMHKRPPVGVPLEDALAATVACLKAWHLSDGTLLASSELLLVPVLDAFYGYVEAQLIADPEFDLSPVAAYPELLRYCRNRHIADQASRVVNLESGGD